MKTRRKGLIRETGITIALFMEKAYPYFLDAEYVKILSAVKIQKQK
jgi:hypothetical protein